MKKWRVSMNDRKRENETPLEPSPNDYETLLSPTGTERSAPNTINTLDAHLGDPVTEHPQYDQPELSEQQLSLLADALAERGALEESARLEIERRHYVKHDTYAPALTTFELTAIALQLVGVKLYAQLYRNSKVVSAVRTVADLIDKSNISPLDERYENHAEDIIETNDGNYLDPFRAISGVQICFFVADDGQRIIRNTETDDVIRADGTPVEREEIPTLSPWYPEHGLKRV